MLGCFRKGDAADPAVFTTAVASVLSGYPEGVVMAVTSPVSGIPAKLKWLPSIAEVREACEAEMAHILREEQRKADLARSRALVAPSEEPIERKSIEELKARCGENWGIAQPDDLGKPRKKDMSRDQAKRHLEVLASMKDAPLQVGPALMKKLEEYRRGEG